MISKGSWFLLLIGTLSCTQSEKNDVETVRLVVTGIIEADNASDVDRVVNYYTTEGVLMPPGKEPIVGSEHIRKNYEGIFRTSELQLMITIDEIKVTADLAICHGKTLGYVISKAD